MQLLGRQWLIMTNEGRQHAVVPRGSAGVVGCTPILKPGECFQYYSATDLPTPSGKLTSFEGRPSVLRCAWCPSFLPASLSSNADCWHIQKREKICAVSRAPAVSGQSWCFAAKECYCESAARRSASINRAIPALQEACGAASRWWSWAERMTLCGPLTQSSPQWCCTAEGRV